MFPIDLLLGAPGALGGLHHLVHDIGGCKNLGLQIRPAVILVAPHVHFPHKVARALIADSEHDGGGDRIDPDTHIIPNVTIWRPYGTFCEEDG